MQLSLKLFKFLPRTIFFWLPLLIIFLSYVFLGRFLRILYVDSISLSGSLATFILAIASIGAMPLALGGIVATAIILALTYTLVGLVPGIVATVAATVVIWLGFQETDTEENTDQDLIWQEWLATLVTLVWAVLVTFAIKKSLSSLPGWITGLGIGTYAGAIAAIGVQIKSVGLSYKQNLQVLGILAGLGIIIGLVHATITYIVITPG